MGTSLTGLTPSTTYDALIKVGDNGALSGTLKTLSDGLGNDSTLSLSTAAASIAGTLAVTGNATFDTNTLFVDAASNEVGIGTTSPSGKLHIAATSGVASLGSTALAIRDAVASNYGFDFTLEGVSSGDMSLVRTELDVQSQVMTFKRSNGNVGIGTTTPSKELEVSSTSGATLRLKRDDGNITTDELMGAVEFFTNDLDGSHIGSYVKGLGADQGGNFGRFGAMAFGVSVTANTDAVEVARFDPFGYLRLSSNSPGIQFNGDTAAANALDDYEEGTWTPVLRGSSTAGTYELGTTYGNYTKIGRQVTLNALITLSGSITGGGVGYLQITGLPFTKSANQEALGSCWFVGVDFTGSFVVPRFIAASANSTLYFVETVDNANPIDLPISGISANDVLNLSITYFV